MPSNYNESLKTVYENTSFDAGSDGWDANIQLNNVKTRRIAASSPFSLIARVSNFTAAGQAWNSNTRYIPMMDLTGNTARLMFVPTAIGYIQHSGTAYNAIGDRAVIAVSNTAAGAGSAQYYATSHAFAIAPSAVVSGATLNTDAVHDLALPSANLPTQGTIDFGAASGQSNFPRLPRHEPASTGTGALTTANPSPSAYATTFGNYTALGNYIFCPVAPLMTCTPALVNNASWSAVPADASAVWSRLVALFGFSSASSTAPTQLPNLVNIHRPSIPFRPVTLGGDPADANNGFPLNNQKVYNSGNAQFSQLGLHYTGTNSDAKIALLDIYGLVLFESA